MRNSLDISSAAQYLDGIRLTGRPQIPVTCHLGRRPLKRKSRGTRPLNHQAARRSARVTMV